MAVSEIANGIRIRFSAANDVLYSLDLSDPSALKKSTNGGTSWATIKTW